MADDEVNVMCLDDCLPSMSGLNHSLLTVSKDLVAPERLRMNDRPIVLAIKKGMRTHASSCSSLLDERCLMRFSESEINDGVGLL